MIDIISRTDAIDMIRKIKEISGTSDDEILLIDKAEAMTELMMMPSAQPEHLTDDDFETIRIHLSAYMEGLCNQGRWKEAEEYQGIINRFMNFASAQPEIIRCKDCKWFGKAGCALLIVDDSDKPTEDDYCSFAEKRGREKE